MNGYLNIYSDEQDSDIIIHASTYSISTRHGPGCNQHNAAPAAQYPTFLHIELCIAYKTKKKRYKQVN
ncbi:hypothetical protein WG66_008538 [Moniliophthora roreri]|nr:hypothetical protein WG66_008538 [Moniliophthora roreri]